MEVQINLDEQSKKILGKVETLHRESMINYAIRLLAGTETFKIISGEIEEKNIPSLDNVGKQEPINEEPTQEKPQPKKPKVAIDW